MSKPEIPDKETRIKSLIAIADGFWTRKCEVKIILQDGIEMIGDVVDVNPEAKTLSLGNGVYAPTIIKLEKIKDIKDSEKPSIY